MNHLLPHPILALTASSAPRTFQAVTLFLDISGFTPLTEALMQQGKHGAEVLAEVINATFRPVIMAIYAHGGYISGFAGDAFTAIFEGAGEDKPQDKEKKLQEAARKAISAAWHIRGMFDEKIVRTPTGGFPLAAKIGMDVGMLECGLLGAETRQAYYYRGPAIDGCARAEQSCRQGEIVLSANLCQQVDAEMEPIEAGFGRLLKWAEAPMPPVIFPTSAALRFYCGVLEMPNAGEFRHWCASFVCFDDFSLSEPTLYSPGSRGETRSVISTFDFGDKGRNCRLLGTQSRK
jgi:class 3 adenylate cyclase